MTIRPKNKPIGIFISKLITIFWVIFLVMSTIKIVKDFSSFNIAYLFLLAVTIFFIIYTRNLTKTYNKLGITIDKEYLTITQNETVKEKNINKSVILYNFLSLNRFGNMIYPTTQRIELKNLKKYGFILDLKGKFKYKTKFNIGLIDKNNNTYEIIFNQFDDNQLLLIIKLIYKITKIKPTGSLEDVLNI